jgi:hypothetical protein
VAKKPSDDDWDKRGYLMLKEAFEYRTAFSMMPTQQGGLAPTNNAFINTVEGGTSKAGVRCLPDNIVYIDTFSKTDQERFEKLYEQAMMIQDKKRAANLGLVSATSMPTEKQ